MQTYLELMRMVRDMGEEHDDRTGVGALSVFGAQIYMRLEQGFPLLTTKKIPLRWVAEEMFWFLSLDTTRIQ